MVGRLRRLILGLSHRAVEAEQRFSLLELVYINISCDISAEDQIKVRRSLCMLFNRCFLFLMSLIRSQRRHLH